MKTIYPPRESFFFCLPFAESSDEDEASGDEALPDDESDVTLTETIYKRTL